VTVAKQEADGSAPLSADGELSNPDFLVWSPIFRRDGAIAVQSYGDDLRMGNRGLSEAQVRTSEVDEARQRKLFSLFGIFVALSMYCSDRYWG
jgi:hypothetical protein